MILLNLMFVYFYVRIILGHKDNFSYLYRYYNAFFLIVSFHTVLSFIYSTVFLLVFLFGCAFLLFPFVILSISLQACFFISRYDYNS